MKRAPPRPPARRPGHQRQKLRDPSDLDARGGYRTRPAVRIKAELEPFSAGGDSVVRAIRDAPDQNPARRLLFHLFRLKPLD